MKVKTVTETIKEKMSVEDYNAAIQQANTDYAAYEDKKQKELDTIAARLAAIQQEERAKKNAHQATTERLQRERDALALEEKLKAFPETLVNGHKFCSVCNAAMRPFKVMESGEPVEYWGCQNGSLRIDHDLVRV